MTTVLTIRRGTRRLTISATKNTRTYFTLRKEVPWNKSYKRRRATYPCPQDFSALSDINDHGKTLFFYLGRCLKLTPHISVENIPARPMILTQHFKVNYFRYFAHPRRDTPAQPYIGLPYLQAKSLLFRLLSMTEIVTHPAMKRVILQLSVGTSSLRISVETPVIRNMR